MTLWNFLKPHIFWVALVAVGLVCGHSWLQEHDARMLASAQIKQSQVEIAQLTKSNEQLRQNIAASDAGAQKAIMALKNNAAKIATPQQAVIAIPDVSTLPLRPLSLPDGRVSVDALSLYSELNTCQQVKTELDACQTARYKDEQIIQNDNKESLMMGNEIKALRAKPSFWHRVGSTLKTVGIGIGIGFALGVRI